MGARNQVEIGLPYRPARLHRLAKVIPRNRFLGSLNVRKFGLGIIVRGKRATNLSKTYFVFTSIPCREPIRFPLPLHFPRPFHWNGESRVSFLIAEQRWFYTKSIEGQRGPRNLPTPLPTAQVKYIEYLRIMKYRNESGMAHLHEFPVHMLLYCTDCSA